MSLLDAFFLAVSASPRRYFDGKVIIKSLFLRWEECETELDAKCYNLKNFIIVIILGSRELKFTDLHLLIYLLFIFIYTCMLALPMPRRGCYQPNIHYQNFITFSVG